MSLPAARLGAVRQAFLFGNFVIGCGVMAVVGVLNDLTAGLHVSVATGGQLIAIAAAVMCFGAPLMAGWVDAACSRARCCGTPPAMRRAR